MSQRLGGMFLGLLLIGGAFLYFSPDREIKNTTLDTTKPITADSLPNQNTGATSSKKQTVTLSDDPEEAHHQKMLQQRIALYDHIDAFIVKYESILCGEYGGPCIEFFVDHAFAVTGYSGTGRIYTFIDNREKLLADPKVSEREREIIGNEIAPLIAYMLWLENNTFQTNETFWKDLVPMLRGFQMNIKYALLNANYGRMQGLPRDYKSTMWRMEGIKPNE